MSVAKLVSLVGEGKDKRDGSHVVLIAVTHKDYMIARAGAEFIVKRVGASMERDALPIIEGALARGGDDPDAQIAELCKTLDAVKAQDKTEKDTEAQIASRTGAALEAQDAADALLAKLRGKLN